MAIEDVMMLKKDGEISTEEANRRLAELNAGFRLDDGKNPGWSKEEMEQGFINQPAGEDVPDSVDMTRDPSRANTVEPFYCRAGWYNVYRNDRGQAYKAIHFEP